MKTDIHRLFSQMTNSYLIKERGIVIVDAGSGLLNRPNTAENFLRRLKALFIEPKDISLVLLTHAHFDHVCSFSQILSSAILTYTNPDRASSGCPCSGADIECFCDSLTLFPDCP